MRDDSLTDDDLAVRAAKEKLAQLSERTGYVDALQIAPHSRTAPTVLVGVALALAALTAWEWQAVANGPLRWLLFLVLLVATAFALVLAIGATTTQANEAFAAAVVEVGPKLSLLRGDGTRRELSCPASIARALRAGDVGIARVRDHSLVEFNRL